MNYSMVTTFSFFFFKFSHQLQSIKQQTHLVPSMTSSLIRASFHFLSENQD